jgi:hypothetical protein
MNMLLRARLMRGLNSPRVDIAQPLIRIASAPAFRRFHMQAKNTTTTTSYSSQHMFRTTTMQTRLHY